MASEYMSAKIAVADLSVKHVSIETISINSKSCNLVGAWQIENTEIEIIKNILGDSPILLLNEHRNEYIQTHFQNNNKLNLNTFVNEAKFKADLTQKSFKEYVEKCEKEYKEYMAISPADRKLVPKVTKKNIEPIYLNNWDLQVDYNSPELTLKKLRKRESIPGTPIEMKLVNTTAWLTKFLIEMWLEDEIERTSKTYLPENITGINLLPPSWLKDSILR